MGIKSWTSFIKEDINLEEDSDDSIDFNDLETELIEKISKSLNSDDESVIDEFVSAYIRDPDSNQIEGLINDADIYDFYLSNRNQIDSLLSEINFYDEVPSDMNCFSLYDYIIKGTQKAISETLSDIKRDRD